MVLAVVVGLLVYDVASTALGLGLLFFVERPLLVLGALLVVLLIGTYRLRDEAFPSHTRASRRKK